MATDVPVFPKRFTEGDTGPPITGRVGTGSTDITDWTFSLEVDRPSPSTLLSKSGTITNTATGDFTFGDWLTTDLVAGEKQLCTVKVVDAGGVLESSEKFVIPVDKKVT